MEPPEARQELDFESVYAAHAPYVRRLLVRRGVRAADLDDVLQEVFVTVHRLLPSFERRSSIETWLHSVTWRVVANYHRRTRGLAEAAASSEQAFDGDASEVPIGGGRLHRAFTAVTDEHRDLLALHEIGGFSLSQISELTGNARATVRERLEKGRTAIGRAIWKTLTDHDQEAWLERLAVGFAEQRQPVAYPNAGPLICAETAISTIDDIVFTLWRGPSSVKALEAVARVLFETVDRNPAGFRYFIVVEPSSTPPSRDARQLMAWIAGKFGSKVRAFAGAVESSALMGLVAPVINSCFFIGGVPIDVRFFNGVAPAVSWIAEFGTTDPATIEQHIDVMRRRLDEIG